jgi:hypothetical protein
MANPDVSAIASSFVEFGGEIFSKQVVNWKLRELGVQVRTNVKAPQPLVKLSGVGGPRPYATGDNASGNGVKYTDRVLTAYQSKWDHDFDPEEFRNTYLAAMALDGMSFAEAANQQIAKEYLASIINNVLLTGVRNGSGTTAAAIADGWGTIIAAEITATNITPVATGALSTSNAVTKVEEMVSAFPTWMREYDTPIIGFCSYATMDKYVAHYRTLNGFKLDVSDKGDYKLDGKNAILRPAAFMKTSGRIIFTPKDNLVFGTDIEQIQVAASVRRNVIESRPMMPVGCQIQDLDALVVNDQA